MSVQTLPRRPDSIQALVYLSIPPLSPSLLGQRPAPQDSPPRQPEREPLLVESVMACFGSLLGCLPLSTE